MSAPTPDPTYLAEARHLWSRFTKAAFVATTVSVVILALMAITLL